MVLPVLRRALFFRATKLAKPLVIFVLGGPGAGKGTQCSKIVEVRPHNLKYWPRSNVLIDFMKIMNENICIALVIVICLKCCIIIFIDE